jgi:tellurite resistance protein TerA
MVELKAKKTLDKGEGAYIPVKQLMVTLRWTMNIDLDLMAFYKAKDGRTGGVFSDNYPGGTLGELNSFPYIQLSGDEGVGGKGGDNEEILRIARLDDMNEVYICTINYDDAIKKVSSSFSNYDGGVIVLDDKGESVAVPLNSTEKGHVAIIAKIDNSSFIGARLINENKIIDLETFLKDVPGADQILNP